MSEIAFVRNTQIRVLGEYFNLKLLDLKLDFMTKKQVR